MSQAVFCVSKSYHGRMGWHDCSNRAIKDGYCNIHHPDTVAAREKAQNAKYEAKQRAQAKVWAARNTDKRKVAKYDKLKPLLAILIDIVTDVDGAIGLDDDEVAHATGDFDGLQPELTMAEVRKIRSAVNMIEKMKLVVGGKVKL